MFQQLISSVLTTVSDLFGGPNTPWIVGVYVIGVIGTAMVVGLILYWLWRPDPASELAKAVAAGHDTDDDEPKNPALADALSAGHVGETVGNEFDDEVVEARNRRILNSNGYGRVSGIDAHGHFFTGQIIHKEKIWRGWEVINGGWVLVQKDRSHRAVWCSHENQVA